VTIAIIAPESLVGTACKGTVDNFHSKGKPMKTSLARVLSSLALALVVIAEPGIAQTTGTPADEGKTPTVATESEFDTLVGRWVRPDGGYVIDIKGVDAGGKLDASYANPRPLPFARAEAKQNGKTIELFFELRAGGYNGSTYTLTYDTVNDILQGVYYQAVAQQKFDIYFERAE
jgi:uncharacterized protein (DUF2147 family)